MYVFDTNAFQQLFKFSDKVFSTLWSKFDQLITEERIISVKEVFFEIEQGGDKFKLYGWAHEHKYLFQAPSSEEGLFIQEIFQVAHFQDLLTKQALLDNRPLADPFIIAKARAYSATAVTLEGFEPDGTVKPNAPKIPQICKYFDIDCVNLDGFMEREGWRF